MKKKATARGGKRSRDSAVASPTARGATAGGPDRPVANAPTALTRHADEQQTLAQSMPANPGKAAEHS